MAREIVVGIDGGGTHTRAVATDLAGHVLASAQTGSASPFKDDLALENVRQAIQEVVTRSDRSPGDVVGLVAGMAGLDRPKDQEWAERFTALPGLNCPRLHVNDAVCDRAAASLSLGIRLVGSCFRENTVEVALIGGAVRSAAMQQAMADSLVQSGGRRYEIVTPTFPCAIGAVLMALRQQGVSVSEPVRSNLLQGAP